MNYNDYCILTYNEIYQSEFKSASGSDEEKERIAQRTAIKETMIQSLKTYKEINAEQIWKSIYAAHVYRKSGVKDTDKINAVISADNSWKKSSGHAFEEMIEVLGNTALEKSGINIYLQKDLNTLIAENKINNPHRDITRLQGWIHSNAFDLYMTLQHSGNKQVFGCIQSKTSIRDRVTRDREPSIAAMGAFFWSIAIVLDGSFLSLPKFQGMVNGGSEDYPSNGWHGMYVFSDNYTLDRIYPVDLELKNFVAHAQKAAKYWIKSRQWFDAKWHPETGV